MITAPLRQQHVELAQLLGAIDQADKARKSGANVRTLLVELSGKLTMHLAAEDRMVYPQLRSSSDALVATMAKRFADEMGGLGGAFKAFMQSYSTGAAIEADRTGFSTRFKAIVAAVSARVKAEETELYPAVDRIGKA